MKNKKIIFTPKKKQKVILKRKSKPAKTRTKVA